MKYERSCISLSKAHAELVLHSRRYRRAIYHSRNSRSRSGFFKLIRSQPVTAPNRIPGLSYRAYLRSREFSRLPDVKCFLVRGLIGAIPTCRIGKNAGRPWRPGRSHDRYVMSLSREHALLSRGSFINRGLIRRLEAGRALAL